MQQRDRESEVNTNVNSFISNWTKGEEKKEATCVKSRDKVEITYYTQQCDS